MLQARGFIEEIGRVLQPVNGQVLHHPYLQALDEGRLPREKLRLFVGEQYTTIGSDLRSVAQLVSRSGHSPSRDFFLEVLQGERAAGDALLTFAHALGMSETDLREYEALPGAPTSMNLQTDGGLEPSRDQSQFERILVPCARECLDSPNMPCLAVIRQVTCMSEGKRGGYHGITHL